MSVTAGIVSKRLNLSENFLDHLVGPSHEHLGPLRRYQIPRGTPSSGALNTPGVGKLAIFVRFSTYIAVYLGNGARSADGYYGTLIGKHGCRIGWYNFR